MKETLGSVLKEKDMVYLVIPQMRLVTADKPCEYKDYVKLLEKLQTLEDENSKKPQHFSSQPECAQFVAKLSADVMKKFEATDPASYEKYQDSICEDHEKDYRALKYVTWSWITALILFVFIWANIGFMRRVGCALIVGLPISIIAFFRSVGRDSRTSEMLPDTLREIIEEEKRDNINKTGKIIVSDYLDIIKDW